MTLTEGDTRISDGVDELAGDDSPDVLRSSTHGVTHREANDHDTVGVWARPDVCELEHQPRVRDKSPQTAHLGDEGRSDSADDSVDNSDSTDDGVFTERGGSERSVWKSAESYVSR